MFAMEGEITDRQTHTHVTHTDCDRLPNDTSYPFNPVQKEQQIHLSLYRVNPKCQPSQTTKADFHT